MNVYVGRPLELTVTSFVVSCPEKLKVQAGLGIAIGLVLFLAFSSSLRWLAG